MYRVELGELGEFFDTVRSGFDRLWGLGERGVKIVQSDVIQDVRSDVEDVVGFVRGGASTVTINGSVPLKGPSGSAAARRTSTTQIIPSTSTFQTRRQLAQKARLPVLIGVGVLAAVFFLRK